MNGLHTLAQRKIFHPGKPSRNVKTELGAESGEEGVDRLLGVMGAPHPVLPHFGGYCLLYAGLTFYICSRGFFKKGSVKSVPCFSRLSAAGLLAALHLGHVAFSNPAEGSLWKGL